jgi:hypothetical protein
VGSAWRIFRGGDDRLSRHITSLALERGWIEQRATLKRPPSGSAGGPAGRFLLHKALFVH